MNLSPIQKELIGRGTMAVVAAALAVGATKLLLIAIRSVSPSPDDGSEFLAEVLFPVVIVMYVLAAFLTCFVFSAWDSSKSNLGRTMVISDFVRDLFEAIVTGSWLNL